jgi:hypothetical protein
VIAGFLFAICSLCQHPPTPADSPFTLADLRTFEAKVCQQSANPNGTLLFLKGGMLAVIRTAIAAMEELERVSPNRDR